MGIERDQFRIGPGWPWAIDELDFGGS